MSFLLTLAAQHCFALDPSTALKDFLIKTWTTKEGLPSSRVYALCRSRSGYLWLGTDTGLVRYDGASFTVFNAENTPGLPNSVAGAALLEDHAGRLWVGIENGLAVITDGRATAFKLATPALPDIVRGLQEDSDGVVWAAMFRGNLYRFKDGQKQEDVAAARFSGNVQSIRADSRGGLWICTQPNRISKLENGRITQFSFEGRAPRSVASTFQDHQNNTWAVTPTSLYRLENGVFRKFLQFSPLEVTVLNVVEGPQGAIWIGTTAGLYRVFDGRVELIDERSGLAAPRVIATLPDADGGLWVGSDGGLNYLRDRQFTTFPKSAEPRGRFVWSVVGEPDGGIWLATTIGAEHISGNSSRTYTTKDGLPSNVVFCVQRDRSGAIWIGTRRGLSRWKDGNIRTFSPADGMPNDLVQSIYQTRAGRLLVSSAQSGVFEFDGSRFSHLLPSPGPVYMMDEDANGRLLLSTSRGLYRWKDGQQLTHVGTTDVNCSSAFPDHDGTIWAIEEPGNLVRIKDGNVLSLRQASSLFHGLLSLREDGQGNLWITSTHGLLRVSKKELNDYLDGGSGPIYLSRRLDTKVNEVFAAQYTIDDGLPSDDFNAGTQNYIWEDRNGRFWLATPRGVVVFDPRSIPVNLATPPTMVEAVIADGRKLPSPEPSALSPDVMRLEFRYTAIDFRSPQQIRFRYRLENFDRGWVDAGSRRIAYYMNLPHGKYTFHVQARSRDGVWNDAEASFAFQIAPHFYRTEWFYLLCAVLIGCTVYGAHLIRMSQFRAAMEAALELRMEERAHIARELHDTLLQGIAGIAMQLSALMQRIPDGQAKSQLGEILNRMEDSTKETRLALRDLRLPAETGRDLVTALESFGQTMVRDTDQRFELEVAGPSFEVSGELSHTLLRIGQEAILNAAKHSHASEIRATIVFRSSELTLTVTDNGQGFEPNPRSESGHWGLVGMKERTKRAGGQIQIVSSPGAGTRVTITVPRPRT